MIRLLLSTLAVWSLILLAPGTSLAQQASASLASCADQPICAGETASLLVALAGEAPYTFSYSDGLRTHTVSTSQEIFELKVSPATTRSYRLTHMEDAQGSGSTTGMATVAVNQCNSSSKKDCADNCFDSKIQSQTTNGAYTTYTLLVSNDGSCQSALSHFSISIPCGSVIEASNSRGWPMEIGTTDPTTGITGLKVDNIKGFGENGQPGSFTVTYTVSTSSCGTSNLSCGFLVAYKAGNCVNYGTATPPYQAMQGNLATTHVKCAGENNGSIMLSIAGGQAPYIYNWSNGAATNSLSNVAAGDYTLTITDATNRQLILNTTVNQPQVLELQATTTQTGCGASTGSIDLQVSGGTAPYSYNWSNEAATQDISNLAAGTYSVVVTDANQCSTTAEYSIQGSSAMDVRLSGGYNVCTTTAITASITGGTAPYTYRWSTGETSASITPAAEGTYSLTVTDASGCTATASTVTTTSSEPIRISYEYSSPSCSNGTDGWIDIAVSGGSGSYTYSWSNGSTTEDLEGIGAGSKTITITDSNGCSATAAINLPQAPSIGIMATEIIHADCQGNLGGITVSAYNGSAPYTYTWSNGATGESLEGLESGYYTVTVTDDMGCSSSRTFQIRQPSAPRVSISGGGCGNETLTAVVSGGSGPYTYDWNTGSTDGSIGAEPGSYYYVVVTDANGCTAEADIQVDEIGSSINLTTTVANPVCAGEATGSVDLTIEGGEGSYTIIWSNGATTEDLENLSPGTYGVIVTDESGCTQSASVTISSPAAITLQATETISANCYGLGGITVAAQGGTAPYTYNWTHGATGESLEDLTAGQYTVTATDANGCQRQQTFSITEEQGPVISINTTGNCGSQTLTAVADGNSGPYTYQWSTGQTTASITPTASGTYNVVVTDANGCTATAATELSLSESTLSISARVTAAGCAGSADGSASIQVIGGTAPYTYDWSNGLTIASATNLTAGVYSVRVTDASGCYDVLAFEINQASPLNINLEASTPTSCGQANGSLSAQVNGGAAPYTFQWNTGATTASISGLAAGTYTLAVADALGCSAEASFDVQPSYSGNQPSAWIEYCQDELIAKGSTADITVYFEGEGPYTLTYTDGSSDHTVTTAANPYVLTVQPLQTTTYTLLSIAGLCKEGEAYGSVTINVANPKTPVCTDGCFSTDMLSAVDNGSCTTYTLRVNAGSNCRYDLSHFEVAVPCGSVSSMSNSEGWPMSVGLDPTTGVYGIKVDNIKGFGENESFTLSYTLCDAQACTETQTSCGPLVSYKAGQCVYFDKAVPFESEDGGFGEIGPGMSLSLYPNPMPAGQMLNVAVKNLFVTTTATVTITNISGLKVHQSSHQISPTSNEIQLLLPDLLAGSYMVSIQFNNNYYTEHLLVY